ncbi:transcriptional regulator GcvA [Paralimibaculum aggregatum]|uniref:Transcriptional regulator GcvA n=2 Tax=Paralimibaculum aggregatum TaxID=3036245 RepID=A0ABQ6LJS3_9RHOB|nr:transcriptional regulator GcvA [Limibaculum sp. NKW23]
MADAAAELGVTESAVSHQIRQLEERLHTALFDRSSGRLVLTETGRRYLARIEPALREIEAATAEVLPARGRTGVRLTLPTSFAATWLIPRLGAFEAANPGIDVQLVLTARLVDLVRDQVDLAIRHGRGSWPGVEAAHLFEDLATPVTAPGLLPAAEGPLSALPGGVRYLVNRLTPGEWEEWARARGLAPPPAETMLPLDAIEQVLQLAEAGHGIGLGRSPYIEPRLERGTLIAPFGGADPTGTGYFLCRAAGVSPSAAARRLARWLEAEAAEFGSAQARAAWKGAGL